jgi:hypothetical protein
MKIIETREDLLDIFKKGFKICEIGVFKGDFSKIIFNRLNPVELHLIDIFEGVMCSGDKDGNNIVWTNLNEEYEKLLNLYKENKNVIIHKGKSYDIIKDFKDNYFDLIYIDGDHSYNGVKNDLNISYLKTKKNGFICGHDYNENKFYDVVKAVNEFCDEKKLKIDYLTKDGCPSFCIEKK